MRDRAWMGEGQRERETQNRKQAPGSEPSAQSPTRGSNSRTARSWPGWSRTLNRLRHPGAPNLIFFKKRSLFIYFERERENEQGRGRVRERKNPKQAPCCQRRAWYGAWSHERWGHDLSQNQELGALPTEPPGRLYLLFVYILPVILMRLWKVFYSPTCANSFASPSSDTCSPQGSALSPLLFSLHRQESAWHGHPCSFKYQRLADITKSKPPGQIFPSISGITYPTRLLYLDVLQIPILSSHDWSYLLSPQICLPLLWLWLPGVHPGQKYENQPRSVPLPYLLSSSTPKLHVSSSQLSFLFFHAPPFKCVVNLHGNL